MPNTITYRPRWKPDAERFAGEWASIRPFFDRAELEEQIADMPNRALIEIVEVIR